MYILALASTLCVTMLAVFSLLDDSSWQIVGIFIWFIWGAGWYKYFYTRTNLFALTCLCFSVISTVLVFAGRYVFTMFNSGDFLLLGFLLIMLGAGAGTWLKQVARRQDEDQSALSQKPESQT